MKYYLQTTKQQLKNIYPFHDCSCGKSYKKPSPLYNHIKTVHDGDFTKFKIDRGVPEGRFWKMHHFEKKYLEKIFEKYIKYDLQQSEEDIIHKFKQIVKIINEIVQNHQIENMKNELLKLNIKLQPVWINIENENIVENMERYFYSYLHSKNIVPKCPDKYEQDNVFNELAIFLRDTQQDEDKQNFKKIKIEESEINCEINKSENIVF